MAVYQLMREDGLIVAEVDAPIKEQAQKEILHYALLYAQSEGGGVEIRKKK